MFGKQGGPYPISLNLAAGRDGTLRALATPEVDTTRYDDVWNIDLRLAKTIRLGGSGLTLAAEWFNVLNNNVVLSRSRFANAGAFTSTSPAPSRVWAASRRSSCRASSASARASRF